MDGPQVQTKRTAHLRWFQPRLPLHVRWLPVPFKGAAYMSTNYGMYCQYFCSGKLGDSPLCSNPGDGGSSTMVQGDGSGGQSRYCWVKR